MRWMGWAAILLGAGVALALPAVAEMAQLREIRPILAADYTRLVIDLGARVDYKLQAIPADPAAGVPARLYVDLYRTRLAAARAARLSPAGGPLLRLRGVQLDGGVTRLILDVPGLGEYRAFPLPDPFRLVVDVHGTARPLPAVARPVRPHPAPAAAAAPVAAPAPVPARPRSLTVVLDPGHGGKDPGAEGAGGLLEKDVVLAVAQVLARRLEAAGYTVILTRDRDVFVSLEERTARAIAAKADLFVSIHGNASPSRNASGIETYYLSNSNDRATIRLAEMENHLGRMTGHGPTASDVSWIVSDMIQNYKIGESLALAGQIQSAMVSRVRERYQDVRDLGVKPGPFYVLVGAGMPAVLTEISFLTHREEAARLTQAAYRERLAEGLLRGIDQFAEDRRMATTL